MSVFQKLGADITAKLATVPAFSGRVGMALGGRGADPNLLTCPVPLAWTIMEYGVSTDERNVGKPPKRSSMECTFKVFMVSEYINQAGLLDEQYPLLEACIAAVGGTQSPVGTFWLFESFKLTKIDTDRQFHELVFSVAAHIQQQ